MYKNGFGIKKPTKSWNAIKLNQPTNQPPFWWWGFSFYSFFIPGDIVFGFFLRSLKNFLSFVLHCTQTFFSISSLCLKLFSYPFFMPQILSFYSFLLTAKLFFSISSSCFKFFLSFFFIHQTFSFCSFFMHQGFSFYLFFIPQIFSFYSFFLPQTFFLNSFFMPQTFSFYHFIHQRFSFELVFHARTVIPD